MHSGSLDRLLCETGLLCKAGFRFQAAADVRLGCWRERVEQYTAEDGAMHLPSRHLQSLQRKNGLRDRGRIQKDMMLPFEMRDNGKKYKASLYMVDRVDMAEAPKIPRVSGDG